MHAHTMDEGGAMNTLGSIPSSFTGAALITCGFDTNASKLEVACLVTLSPSSPSLRFIGLNGIP